MFRHCGLIIGVVIALLALSTTALHAHNIDNFKATQQEQIPTIQFEMNELQVGILFNNNRLFTFEPTAQLSTLLTNKDIMATQLASFSSCQMFDERSQTVIPTTTTLFHTFIHHDAVLQCQSLLPTASTAPTAPTTIAINHIVDEKLHVNQQHVTALRQDFLKRESTASRPYPRYKADIVSLSIDTLIGWALNFIQYHWGPMHSFPTYQSVAEQTNNYDGDVGIYHFNGKQLTIDQSQQLAELSAQSLQQSAKGTKPTSGTAVFAVTADWGAGTEEAQLVSHLMAAAQPEYTINMGDLYLVGSPEDARTNALGIRYANDTFDKAVTFLPGKLGTFWYQGNHEMYSRGWGYFDSILPNMGFIDPATKKPQGQKTSYSLMENENWRILFLDTGYTTYSPLVHNDTNVLLPEVVDWLKNVVKLDNPSDKRGIVIMTHHNFVSAFGKGQYLDSAKQIKAMVKDRMVLTIWGHEHKTAIYEPSDLGALHAFPRCIGTGGFPVDNIPVPPTTRESGLIAFDNRPYDQIVGSLGTMTVGYNGYFFMNFTGEFLDINYYTIQWKDKENKVLDWSNGHQTMAERFTVDWHTGNIQQVAFTVLDKDITVINNANRPFQKLHAHDQSVTPMRKKLIEKQTDFDTFEELGLDLETYYFANKDQRYTRRLGQKPQYTEETTKIALKKYILQTLAKTAAETTLTADDLDVDQLLDLIQSGAHGKKQTKTLDTVKQVEIDYNQIVDIDGHKFPFIKF